MENELKKLRITTGVPAKTMVEIVKGIYPKYDKTCQSKCENTQDYGVMLAPDAMRLLQKRLIPEVEKPTAKTKHGQHRLTCRIACRLPDEDYAALQHRINADGYSTVQSWLAALVKEYLSKGGDGK